MEDRDFFDLLYQAWSKTTWAEDAFWKYTEVEPGTYVIDAVSQERGEKFIASLDRDEDADFITAVHGCLPDLVRRLNDALDEADRLDEWVDVQTGRIADLEMEVSAYRDDNLTKTDALVAKDLEIQKLLDQLETERANVEFWRSHE